MKERPILFSEPMVRAILVGRKTQTRRVVKQVPHWQHCGRDIMEWGLSDCYTDDKGSHWLDIQTHVDDNSHDEIKCPFGQHGDRLWVRENGWERPDRTRKQMREGADTWAPYYYDADGICVADIDGFGFKRRPSIHMPRWASRITLEITAVRVERLQDISEEDAEAEGVYEYIGEPQVECDGQVLHFPDASFVRGYLSVWESIHGPGSWAANPWVWVLEFPRVEGEK